MKTIISALLFVFIASNSIAANFQPTLLKLNAPSKIRYNFDGKNLEIPVTVSGTMAGVIFFVYTKDKANLITKTRNGFLGWHYVNKVDTCMYFSSAVTLPVGKSVINWSGREKGGGLLGAGEYTYYLWGYDNKNPKTRVANGTWYPYSDTNIVTKGPGGKALDKPMIHNVTSRWTIGNSTEDLTLYETTKFTLPTGWTLKYRTYCHPGDTKYFYAEADNSSSKIEGLYKYQWVPQGNSILEVSFGDNGVVTWNQPIYQGSGPTSDGNYIYAGYYGQYQDGISNKLYKIDFDGSIQTTFDLTEWLYHPDDYKAGGQSAGGPTMIHERNGYLFLNHSGSCLKSMINPSVENKSDLFVWVNQNGDYVNDTNWQPTSQKPWVCFDFNTGPYCYSYSIDANMFSITPSYDLGAVSFALMGPDGTGINYFAFAGETARTKRGLFFVDTGCAYDGIYCDNMSSNDTTMQNGIWYMEHDSISGVIATDVGVEEVSPSAFVVSQNTPNPFNPSTTINFTLPKTAKTTLEIYNSAGQKVSTLVNTTLNAGVHSATWNASKFSAGVYFYTIKSGDISNTMKMTLLR
ncbi:MAG: T9SS type A sorting domain-containing protein [Candidatus Latescibacter sp.]|nr:T9SS type A sorting domain-containing protein [Candidatus Latescibacter sp.]